MPDRNIILIGMKACGKSTVGRLLANKLGIEFIELDREIEKTFGKSSNEYLTLREIFKKHGAQYFRKLESEVLKKISQGIKENSFVLSCGGGTPLNPENHKLLRKMGKIIFLDTKEEILLPRILKNGMPAFFPYPDNPKKSLSELMEKRRPVYQDTSNYTIAYSEETPNGLVEKIINIIKCAS